MSEEFKLEIVNPEKSFLSKEDVTEVLVPAYEGDMGILKDGNKGPNYEPGIELLAKQTIFSEGCRGHLGKILMNKFDLNKNNQNQTYAIGIKELWEIDPKNHNAGEIVHTTGWPLSSDTYGGSFL